MAKNQADFTLTFRRLATPRAIPQTTRSGISSPIPPPMTNGPRAGASATAEEPQSAGERQAAMRAVNPAFIPRNHRVEAVIQAAVNRTTSRRSRNC